MWQAPVAPNRDLLSAYSRPAATGVRLRVWLRVEASRAAAASRDERARLGAGHMNAQPHGAGHRWRLAGGRSWRYAGRARRRAGRRGVQPLTAAREGRLRTTAPALKLTRTSLSWSAAHAARLRPAQPPVS